jgi:RNA polymerase sigma factor (sigma-70 family)
MSAAAAPRLRLVSADGYPDWEAAYRDNVASIYRVMLARTGSRPDAEDLTAQVFLAALPSLRITAPRPQVRAYLAATARTVLAAHWRRTFGLEVTAIDAGELEATLADPYPGPGPAPDPEPPGRARAQAILARLPARYRSILELRFLSGCTLRESARELGISVSNASGLQHRALRLAARIADGDPADGDPAGRDPAGRAPAGRAPAGLGDAG